MKKLVVGLVSAAALATLTVGMAAATNSMNANQSSNNSAAGIYVSGNVGYAKVKNNQFDGFVPNSALTGFAWNASLGYQYSQYVAAELGYTSYPEVKHNISDLVGDFLDYKAQTSSVDLLVKGIYPINDQFNLFAKAGVAYVVYKQSASDDLSGISEAATETQRQYVPEFGIGAGYNVTQNVAITIQGLTTLAGENDLPATYTGLVGASYKFNM